MSIGGYLKTSNLHDRKVAEIIDLVGMLWCGTSGGSSNAFTLTPSIKINDYKDGTRYMFKADRNNTGAATLNISGRGTKDITNQAGSALSSGDITQNDIVTLLYLEAADDFILVGT